MPIAADVAQGRASFPIDLGFGPRMEFSSLAGAIALCMLVYKFIECSRVNATLTTANRRYEVENGRLRTSINSMQGSVDGLNGKAAASRSISALESSLEESTRKLNTAEDEVAVLSKRVAVLLQSEKVLRRERDAAHLDAKRALASAEAAGRAVKDLAIVEKERDEVFGRMEAKDGEAIELGAKLAGAERRLAEVEAKFSDLSGVKVALDEKAGKAQAALDAKIAELETLRAEKDAVVGQVQNLSAQVAELDTLRAEKDAVVGQVQKLSAQVAELQAEKDAAARDMQESLDGKAAELETLRAEKDAVVGEVQKLTAQVAELQAENAKCGELSRELDELRAENHASNTTEQANLAVATLEARNAELERRVVEADASYSNAAAERAHAKAELAEVEASSARKIAQLEADLAALAALKSADDAGNADDAAAKELNAKIDQLHARIAGLESELTECQLSSTMLKEELAASMNKIGQLQGLNATLVARLKGS